jgi:hypothetical protein
MSMATIFTSTELILRIPGYLAQFQPMTFGLQQHLLILRVKPGSLILPSMMAVS